MSAPDQPTPNPFRLAAVDISEAWVNGDPAWGVEERHEVSEGGDGQHRVLCECGHPTEAEALACAEPRSVEGLARRAYAKHYQPRSFRDVGFTTAGHHAPTFDDAEESVRGRWRETVYEVVKVLR